MMGGLTPLFGCFYRRTAPRRAALTPDPRDRRNRGPAARAVADRLPAGRAGGDRVVLVLCALVFRDRPEQKPGVKQPNWSGSAREGRPRSPHHGRVPWLRILRSGNLWLLCVMYGCQSYGWYFYITSCRSSARRSNNTATAEHAVVAACSRADRCGWAHRCLVGGFLTDWFIRRTGNRRLGRRLFGAVGTP